MPSVKTGHLQTDHAFIRKIIPPFSLPFPCPNTTLTQQDTVSYILLFIVSSILTTTTTPPIPPPPA
jgi:hypothetical protein